MQLIKRTAKDKTNTSWASREHIGFIKTWQLVILIIIFGALSAWSLRQNSLKTLDLQGKVLMSDELNVGTEEAVKELGDHIISSMNSDMAGPIQLPNSFNRDYEKLVLSSEEVTNSQYLSIREKCVTFDVPVEAQSECIRNETNQITSEEFSLPLELYSFDFKSPLWSPDMAGWSSLLTVVFSTFLFIKIASEEVTRAVLKKHH